VRKQRPRRKHSDTALLPALLTKKTAIDVSYGYVKNRVYVLADSFIKMGENITVLGIAGMLLNFNSYSEKVFALGVLLLGCGILSKKTKEL
jgi:hypothetical protein